MYSHIRYDTILYMVRGFFESHGFTRKMNKINEPDLSLCIEKLLLGNPKAGKVIPGLIGIRKIRISSEGKGKRGGYRVIYIDLPRCGRIYLLAIYGKEEKIDLTSDDKRVLRKLVEEIRR